MAGAKRASTIRRAGLCFAQAAGAQIVELVLVETAYAGGVLAFASSSPQRMRGAVRLRALG